jgi:hypothetical protein
MKEPRITQKRQRMLCRLWAAQRQLHKALNSWQFITLVINLRNRIFIPSAEGAKHPTK